MPFIIFDTQNQKKTDNIGDFTLFYVREISNSITPDTAQVLAYMKRVGFQYKSPSSCFSVDTTDTLYTEEDLQKFIKDNSDKRIVIHRISY